MSNPPSKLSFTIRRPTPVSRSSSTGAESDSNTSFKVPALPRHLSSANSSGRASPSPSPLGRASPIPKRTHQDRDSSDEDEGLQDELVTGFDQFGVQRLHAKPTPEGPLVIPALKDRDWRDLARKRKQIYIPPSAAAATGADGSVGGLGTRDSINSGPQLSGLQLVKKARLDDKVEDVDGDQKMADVVGAPGAGDGAVAQPAGEETEDQRALRAVLASAQSTDANGDYTGPVIDIIPTPAVSEEDAYKQDVVALPDSATLDDYERVPVSQFGAALLRGMGWKEGEVASRSKRFQGKGQDGKQTALIEPWIPTARPALLGIGAKEKEVFDDGSKGGKGGKGKGRPDRKYIPIVKVEKNGSERIVKDGSGESQSGSSSRRSPIPSRGGSSRRSPSPSNRERRRDREYERVRPDNSEATAARSRRKDRDRESYKEDRDKEGRRDHDGTSSRRDREREFDRHRNGERASDRDSSSRRKDRDRREY